MTAPTVGARKAESQNPGIVCEVPHSMQIFALLSRHALISAIQHDVEGSMPVYKLESFSGQKPPLLTKEQRAKRQTPTLAM